MGDFITDPNRSIGICGFVSVLGLIYDKNPLFQVKLHDIDDLEIYETRLLSEVCTYLTMLKGEGEIDLLNKIREFTFSFGYPYQYSSIDEMIKQGQNFTKLLASNSANELAKKYKNSRDPQYKFGIAMPPDGVMDYLKRNYDVDSELVHNTDGGNIIIGLKSNPPNQLYGGLTHWIYLSATNTVYNHGTEVFGLETYLEANSEYERFGKPYLIRPKFV